MVGSGDKQVITKDGVYAFIEEWSDNGIKPNLKSEVVRSDDALSIIQIVRGDSFQDMVIEEKESAVLLIFYANWCGACKRLLNGLEEVAFRLQKQNVKVMKIEATGNEIVCEGVRVDSFPAVYYFANKRNGKSVKEVPVAYNRIRFEVADIMEFVKEAETRDEEVKKGLGLDLQCEDCLKGLSVLNILYFILYTSRYFAKDFWSGPSPRDSLSLASYISLPTSFR